MTARFSDFEAFCVSRGLGDECKDMEKHIIAFSKKPENREMCHAEAAVKWTKQHGMDGDWGRLLNMFDKVSTSA